MLERKRLLEWCVIGATVVNLQVGIFILRQSVSIVFVSGFIVQFFKTMHKSEWMTLKWFNYYHCYKDKPILKDFMFSSNSIGQAKSILCTVQQFTEDSTANENRGIKQRGNFGKSKKNDLHKYNSFKRVTPGKFKPKRKGAMLEWKDYIWFNQFIYSHCKVNAQI